MLNYDANLYLHFYSYLYNQSKSTKFVVIVKSTNLS